MKFILWTSQQKLHHTRRNGVLHNKTGYRVKCVWWNRPRYGDIHDNIKLSRLTPRIRHINYYQSEQKFIQINKFCSFSGADTFLTILIRWWIDYFGVASNRLPFINLTLRFFNVYSTCSAFIFWCEKIHCFWKIELKTKNSLQMHVRNKITTNFSHIESISIFFTVWSKFYEVKNYISFLYEI